MMAKYTIDTKMKAVQLYETRNESTTIAKMLALPVICTISCRNFKSTTNLKNVVKVIKIYKDTPKDKFYRYASKVYRK